MANEPIVAVIAATETIVAVVRERGIPGPPGPPGSSAAEELTAYTAGGAINAYQPLFITNSLTVLPASGENATHAGRIIGMSISAAATGETVYCKRSGNVTNPAWALTPGERYYIGAGGELTTSTTGMAFVQKIGIADSATVLFLQIEPPILE